MQPLINFHLKSFHHTLKIRFYESISYTNMHLVIVSERLQTLKPEYEPPSLKIILIFLDEHL